MNYILAKYSEEVKHILAAYPTEHKRAAVMPLLHLAQRETGFISRKTLLEVAEITEITATEVASVVGFYSLFHDAPAGKIRLQVCTDVACDLRGAGDYLKELCEKLGIHPGETTPDGLVTIEEVKCLAACDKAPLFQAQIGDEVEYHENQTPARTLDWLRGMSTPMIGSPLKTASNLESGAEDGGSRE